MRWRARISDFVEFQLSEEKSTAILTLPTPFSQYFHLCWNWEKESVFEGKNGEFILLIHFDIVIAWNLTFFMPSVLSRFSPDSAANMQQSTVKEGGAGN